MGLGKGKAGWGGGETHAAFDCYSHLVGSSRWQGTRKCLIELVGLGLSPLGASILVDAKRI